MKNKKGFWNNGSKIWQWILISVFVIGIIGQAAVNRYQIVQNSETGKKAEAKTIENDKRIAVLESKIDNLIDGQKEMNRKLDRVLGR